MSESLSPAGGTPRLAAALARVQAELPTLDRDRTVEVQQKNGATYTYSYVTLARLSEVVLPLLARHGLAWAALPGSAPDGKFCLNYRLMHESGEELKGSFPLSGEGGIQMLGGRITYARRYALAAVVGVAAEEDDDSRLSDDAPRTAQRRPQTRHTAAPPRAASTTAARQPLPPPLPGDDSPVTRDQIRHMHALWSDLGLGGTDHRDHRLAVTARIVGRDDLDTSTALTAREADQVITALRERLTQGSDTST